LENAAKEILQGDTRGISCLGSCPYLFLFLAPFYRLSRSDLGLLMSYQLGQYRASENDEERADRGFGSSEAC
jgi:hypothetical protein